MRTRAFLVPLVLLALVPVATAQRAGVDADGNSLSLPYHDARLVDGETVEDVRVAIAASRDQAMRAARVADLQRLADVVPALRLDVDEMFGTPHFLRSWAGMLTAPRDGATPEQVVRDFVAAYPGLFEIAAEELDATRFSRNFVTRHNGVTHLTFQQQIDGIDLWGAELKANVTPGGELVNISSTIVPRPAGGFDVPAARLGPVDALRLAAASVGIELVTVPTPRGPTTGVNQRTEWNVGSELRPDTTVYTEQILFPLSRADVRPAWSTIVAEPGPVQNTYEMIVDATTGEVLRRWNQMHFLGGTEDISFRVWPSDSPQPGSPGTSTPTGFQFPEVARQLITVTGAGVSAASPEGWIPDGVNETLGNNVDGHVDLDADNNPDLPRPQGSPYRVFDFPVDLATQAPSQFVDASVANLFYACNIYHDVLYALGWDEAASNFQDDNFGMGGVGGDRLSADGQDGSTVNNAQFFGSGGDGSSARIQQYVFTGPDPDIDGGLDNDVVYHEISHGLSIRLSGGTVSGEQSGGMGEGWGDYFGVAINAEPGDDPHGVYAMGGYATTLFAGLTDNYYFGIRRYPYSTDLNKSPLTYADTDPAQQVLPGGIPQNPAIGSPSADEVHNVGEIWCQALLECRANLWDAQGFSGNQLMMQLVVDGMKLMPSNPNMLQARDGIISADIINNGGANLGELWTGFAKRGMGGSATSPSGSTTTGIVEAFDIPPLILVDYPNGQPDQLAPMTATTFEVNFTGLLSDAPLAGTGLLEYSVNGGSFVAVPMLEGVLGEYDATLPSLSCFDQIEYFVTVDTTAGLVTDPPDGASAPFFAEVFTSVDTVFADDLEADLGWTVGGPGDGATTGVWERGDPVGTAAQPEDDNTPDPGTQCFMTGQGLVGGGLGDNDVDGGQTTLTSPVIDLSSGDARIGYNRWYSNDTGGNPNADVFTVDVSDDGGASWTNVETVGPSGAGTSGGWIRHEFTVSDFVTPSAQVQVRFIAADEGDGSLVEAAVDDFSVFRLLCAEDGCMTDLGFGGPGSMTLSLCGPEFITGATNDLLVTGAPPFGNVFLVFGLSNNPVPFKGGFLVPVPILVTIVVPADLNGEIFATLPGGGGPFAYYLQAVAPDGAQVFNFALSNAIEVQVGP